VKVDAKAVILSITVQEHPELEEHVRTLLDTRDHTTGRESRFLYIAMVIFWIFI